jgi:hypothetical protein
MSNASLDSLVTGLLGWFKEIEAFDGTDPIGALISSARGDVSTRDADEIGGIRRHQGGQLVQ